ncbi:MAG: Ig-like domain-containing protein [Deltaproteobacteria bacterium]|nr:Ig-like domain-containing protein [Deltaproteobacteria bacterium]
MRDFRPIVLLAAFSACGAPPLTQPSGPSPTPESKPASAPPAVKNTLPGDGETNVATTTLITIVFAGAMDEATINERTIHLEDGTGGHVSWRGGRTATFLPTGGLRKGATYTVVVGADVANDSGVRLGADFTFSFTTVAPEPTKDTLAPTVLSTTPAAAAEDVAVNTLIHATLSENVASVPAGAFSVGGVPGTVAVNGATITFTPSAPLLHATTYKATLSTAITDTSGNALAAKHEWLFTTEEAPDTSGPVLAQAAPEDGAHDVDLASIVALTFDEPVKATSVTSTSVRLEANGASVPVFRNTSGAKITLTPKATLTPGTVYTVIVTSAVRDLIGNAMAPLSITFTTVPPPDTVPPVVVSATPVNGAMAVAVNVAPAFVFNEALDPLTAVAANVTLKDAATSDVAFSVGYAAGTLTVTPSAPLTAATTYTATLGTGLTDVAGNPLAAPYVLVFTTAL